MYKRQDEGLPLKYILPESRPLLEQYRELGLADISPEQYVHLYQHFLANGLVAVSYTHLPPSGMMKC